VTNKRCPNCGFINFLKDESCRKCNTPLADSGFSEEVPGYAYGFQNRYEPPKKSFPVLKVFLGVFFGLIVFAVLTGAGVSLLLTSKVEWRPFRPAGAAVTVNMPKEPKVHDPIVTPMPGVTLTNHMFTATVGGQGSAMYCFVDFSADLSVIRASYSKLLDGELNDLVTRTNSTIVSKQSISVEGNPGLEFELKPPSNSPLSSSAKTFGKMFIAKNQLYLLVITAKEDSQLLTGKDTFLTPAAYF